ALPHTASAGAMISQLNIKITGLRVPASSPRLKASLHRRIRQAAQQVSNKVVAAVVGMEGVDCDQTLKNGVIRARGAVKSLVHLRAWNSPQLGGAFDVCVHIIKVGLHCAKVTQHVLLRNKRIVDVHGSKNSLARIPK